ncbi:MAG: primosomal protein N' [Planctomycetaceae bacterium]|jgi:primosomal protein N' (replication factor Y)|nr:primosomal protein N' [Planctomycetaceae bacterium]
MLRQQTFFDEEPLPQPMAELPPWELDDLKNRLLAKVVFPTGYDAVLDYLVPNELAGKIEPGMRVMVPLGKGNRSVLGYCLDIQRFGLSVTNIPLKSIQSPIDEHRLLNEKMLELTRWIAQHYLCPIGQVFEAMLPAGVRSNAGTRLTTVLYVTEDVEQRLAVLRKINVKEKGIALTPKQLHVLETLRQSVEPLTSPELQHAAKCSTVPINTLKRLGLFRVKTIRRQKTETDILVPKKLEIAPYQLNSDQQRALTIILDAVRNNRHETFLLHGVTGSGKTEVYIQAIHEVVRRKRQAIVLVPEISLTPQTVGRFKSRFPDVAVLHSHLTDAERHRQWTSIAEGHVQVAVGARSAVFAPFPKLGLIVIDEEHENSFKQDSTPRYHARDVARKRAELENIPLILGSATPSLESWHSVNSQNISNKNVTNSDSRTQLISMPNRVKNLRLPLVEIVDLREEIRNRTTRGAVHRQLHIAIRSALNEKGQVILLLNRRGFSTHIQCPACGDALKCPNCDVSLTHHKTEEIALCHYCDYQIPAPTCCPKCRCAGIWYGGFGTQKLETEIKTRFPDVSVLRMDTDTMQGPGAHERALTQFREGNVQILLGTQMIAKGLDFPNVTLVGVINADTALHLPDFRASERTFHLITQVAGRTGRGEKGGRVIIQTFSPDHPAILAAAKHDYKTFVAQELPMRKLLGYPPYTKMIRIVVRGENETKTREFAAEFAKRLKTSFSASTEQSIPFRILGPAPAPFAKLRGFYRFHIHLHDVNGERLHNLVRSVSLALKTPAEVQWIIDVDPIDML